MDDQVIMILRILLAAACGSLIGWQREKAHKPAGLRTHMLIAMGAALFTVVSIYVFPGDPARISANIVTGIGFLGAGAIIHRTQAVEGLTTAASIWMVAAIGLAAGAGLYIIAPAATIIVFLVLYFHPYNREGIDHEEIDGDSSRKEK